MIAFLRGRVSILYDDAVVVDVGGVGYRVHVPASTRANLPRPGGEVFLHTHLIVREDGPQLYGFLSAEELEVFVLLINVGGVGPRVALSVLSALSPERFRSAVVAEDVAALMAVPGVGRKTAQRIVLELKDRISVSNAWLVSEDTVAGLEEEVVDALISLGYNRSEARSAVRAAAVELGKVTVLEELVRASLSVLDRTGRLSGGLKGGKK